MMSRLRLILSASLFILFVAGCSALAYTPVPTPFPADYVPTVIALTVRAGEQTLATPSPVVAPENTETPRRTPTQEPTHTFGPSPTAIAYNPPSVTATTAPSATRTPDLSASPTRYRIASRTPTITRTPVPPGGQVQISYPGPMSKVVSPVYLEANVRSIAAGSYHVEIVAEPLQAGGEARLLYREVHRILGNPGDWIFFHYDIQFELSRVSEFGQLRISVFDIYDRLAWANSVNLILLSMGEDDITPKGRLSEPIVIREPTPNHLIQGGTVIVSGEAMPSEDFMLVELVTYEGKVVGYRQAYVTPSADGSYVPFTVEVPYTVTAPTWVRLRISESGARVPGIERANSIEVLLSP